MQSPARFVMRAGLAGLALAAPLAAQDPVKAKAPALWVGGDVGPGWFRLSCRDICIGDRQAGWSARVAGGVRLGRAWLGGLQVTGWLDEREGIRERAIFVGPTVRWYPAPKSRLWLDLAAGILSWRADDPDDPDDEPFTASPVAGVLGAGYDVPLSGRLQLVPFASFTGTIGGSVTVDGAVVTDDPNFSLLRVGVGVTYR